MLVVVSGSFTLAFGADFTFQIRDLGLSQCHSNLTPFPDPFSVAHLPLAFPNSGCPRCCPIVDVPVASRCVLETYSALP